MKKSISLMSLLWLATLCNSTCATESIDIADSIKGRVVLEFVVTKEGKVIEPKVIKSVPAGVFDAAALEAAKKLRFKPPTENGVPVEATISKAMRFEMSAAEFEADKTGNNGIKHLRNGEYETAISDFSAAIGTTPENGQYYDLRGQAYNSRAFLYKKLEDMGSMCLDLKKVCELGDCRGIEIAKKAAKCR